MKNISAILLLFSFALISGCASYAQPNFFNGKYYLAGDDNCRYMRQQYFPINK